MGIKLILVRILATCVIIIGSFAVSWYIFTRLSQLNKPGNAVPEEDINNPRLNKSLLNQIKEDLDKRSLYTTQDKITIQIKESDPFFIAE